MTKKQKRGDGVTKVTLTYRGESVTLDEDFHRKADEALRWLERNGKSPSALQSPDTPKDKDKQGGF